MPNRPRSHILEDESLEAFKSALPASWVVRSQTPDYGMDVLVQIFKEEKATPNYFFVQLKGTDKRFTKNSDPSYSFSTEHLSHYFKHPIPVMLVLYESKNKNLYFKWAHKIYEDLDNAEREKLNKQKSLTISFKERLNDKFTFLESEVAKQISKFHEKENETGIITIILNFKINKNDRICLTSKISEWLVKNDFNQFIFFKESGKADGEIKIHPNPLTLEIESKLVKYSKIPFPKYSDQSSKLHDLFSISLLMIAELLVSQNKPNKALSLVSKFLLSEKEFSPTCLTLLSIPFWPVLYSKLKRPEEALDIAKKFVHLGFIDHGIGFSSAYTQIVENEEFHKNRYIKFIKYSISKAKDKLTRGRLHYNLGNALRGNNLKAAIKEYIKSAEFDPKYKKRAYWWKEIGGCYFELEDYFNAVKCYKKSVRFEDKSNLVVALLGDAFLYLGKFSEAEHELQQFFNTEKVHSSQFALKCWLSDYLKNNFGNTKRNTRKSSRLLKHASVIQDEEGAKPIIENAIRADPLNFLALEEYVTKEWSDVIEARAFIWLQIAILNRGDISAWANTLILYAFDFKENPLQSSLYCQVILEGFRLHGENLKSEIERILNDQLVDLGGIGKNFAKTLDVAFEDLTKKNPEFSEPKFTYRLFNND